jgi:hypothetical protein
MSGCCTLLLYSAGEAPLGGVVRDLFAAGGRYWVRTSDLFGVNEARYHCANRPSHCSVQLLSAGATIAHRVPRVLIEAGLVLPQDGDPVVPPWRCD